MKEAYWGYWLIILGIFIVVIMLLIQNITSNNSEDFYNVRQINEAAMVSAVDYAYYREYGELRINKEKFMENFMRMFAESASLTSDYDVTFAAIYEAPPKASVEIISSTDTYIIASDSTEFDLSARVDAVLEQGIGKNTNVSSSSNSNNTNSNSSNSSTNNNNSNSTNNNNSNSTNTNTNTNNNSNSSTNNNSNNTNSNNNSSNNNANNSNNNNTTTNNNSNNTNTSRVPDDIQAILVTSWAQSKYYNCDYRNRCSIKDEYLCYPTEFANELLSDYQAKANLKYTEDEKKQFLTNVNNFTKKWQKCDSSKLQKLEAEKKANARIPETFRTVAYTVDQTYEEKYYECYYYPTNPNKCVMELKCEYRNNLTNYLNALMSDYQKIRNIEYTEAEKQEFTKKFNEYTKNWGKVDRCSN